MRSSLSADVFELLHDLMHRFRARLLSSLESIQPGLTFNEFRILMHTGRHPGITQKELVEHSHTDKAQMARTLAQLQDKGWLERSASTQDKRLRCLRLSAQGQALFRQLRQQRQRIAAELLHDFPAAEQAQLQALLQRALDSVRSLEPAQPSSKEEHHVLENQ